MKKQILLITFFVLAVFAGVNNAYGQYQTTTSNIPTCLTPNPLDPSCSDIDQLHPQPGIVYTYTVTTTDATDDVRWFVVNNNDLEDAAVGGQVDSIVNSIGQVLPVGSSYIEPTDGTGDFILNLGTVNTEYNIAPSPGDTDGTSATGTDQEHAIDIAWKYFDGLTEEVLLVGFVTGDDGCTDNIFAYRILPNFTFTLDVAALDSDGDSVSGPQTTYTGDCVSPIENAFYTPSADPLNTPGTLTVDWGENWVFFIVNAANFVDSWMPTFEISYTGGTGDPLEASWTYLAAADNASATWNAIDIATGTTAVPVIAGGSDNTGAPTNALSDGVAAADGGECIVVRVRVDHGTTNENTDVAGETISFAVNGVMYDNVGIDATDLFNDDTNYEDLHYADCTQDDFDNDWVEHTLTPRPEVDEVDPTPFETKTGDE